MININMPTPVTIDIYIVYFLVHLLDSLTYNSLSSLVLLVILVAASSSLKFDKLFLLMLSKLIDWLEVVGVD